MSPWVLLRGLTRESRHWGAFPKLLAEASGAEVICIDLPGNGLLNRRRSPTTVAETADFCHVELAARGASPPCLVLAMSLGAMVAVAWAERHPQDISGAVLINTSMRPYSPFYQRLRGANYARILSLLLTRPRPREVERAVLEMTSTQTFEPSVRAALLDEWCRWRQENPVTATNALRQLWAAARFRAPPKAPPIPLLLLASRGDRLVDHRCSRRLATAWDVPLALHEQGGHDLPLDDPKWVIGQVTAAGFCRRPARADF